MMRACGGLPPILPDLAEGVNRQGSRKFPEERKDGRMGIRGGAVCHIRAISAGVTRRRAKA